MRVSTDIPRANIVAKDDKDVWFILSSRGTTYDEAHSHRDKRPQYTDGHGRSVLPQMDVEL